MTAVLLPGIPMARYVADQFDPQPPSLSSSVAHRLLTRSPLHAWTCHPRLNEAFKQDDEREFDLGTAAHAVLLENQSLYVVQIADEKTGELIDATDYKKKAAQEARKAAKAQGLFPVLAHQAEAIREMVMVARLTLANSPDLVGIRPLMAEQTLIWQDSGAWCRSRPDWMTEDRAVVISYKTTSNAEPDAFTRHLLTMGYHTQAAFELAGLKAATGVDATYVWLVSEVEPPYACSLVGMSPMLLDLAQATYRRAVEVWARCLASGHWPAYPDRIAYAEPPPWAVAQFAERHMYADMTTEAL